MMIDSFDSRSQTFVRRWVIPPDIYARPYSAMFPLQEVQGNFALVRVSIIDCMQELHPPIGQLQELLRGRCSTP